MRIAIIGVPGLGVERVQQMFRSNWKMYNFIDYHEYPEQKTDDINVDMINSATQMLSEIKKYDKMDDNVIFTSIPLELLMMSFSLCEQEEITEDTVKKLAELSNESLKYLDCVFIVPKSKFNAVEDVSVTSDEIDYFGQLYDIIIHSYNYGEKCIFFNLNDCPGFIEIFGTDEQKLQLFKQYIDENGKLIDGNIQKLLSPEEVTEGQDLLQNAIDRNKQIQKKEAFWKQLNQYKHGK